MIFTRKQFGHTSRTTAHVFLAIILLFVTDMDKCKPSSVPPVIADNPDFVTSEEGDMAVLYCSVINLGDHTVTWRKLPDSAPLTIGTTSWTRDSRVHSEHVPNSSQWNLVIEQVSVEDAGQYECQVSKRDSQLRHTVTLTVKARPVALLPRIEISGENVLKAGSLLRLICNASLVDVAVERITWVKDGEPLLLDKDHRYSIHTSLTLSGQNSGIISSRLDVRNAQPDDSGVYLCRSTERSQMAGVKVEIQGAYNSKRDDSSNFDKSAPFQMSSTAGNNNSASSLLPQTRKNVMFIFSTIYTLYIVLYHSFAS